MLGVQSHQEMDVVILAVEFQKLRLEIRAHGPKDLLQ
jgi:hypothetical protein